jgi:putative transposase
MTRLEDRQARDDGARLSAACAVAGIDARTLQRWKAGDRLLHGDRRVDCARPVPSHALSAAERARIIEVANEPRFADTPPARIVPTLADEGIYLASDVVLPSLRAAAGHSVQRSGYHRPCRGVAGGVSRLRDGPWYKAHFRAL